MEVASGKIEKLVNLVETSCGSWIVWVVDMLVPYAIRDRHVKSGGRAGGVAGVIRRTNSGCAYGVMERNPSEGPLMCNTWGRAVDVLTRDERVMKPTIKWPPKPARTRSGGDREEREVVIDVNERS